MMATSMATPATRIVPKDERRALALARIQCSRSRPSTVAAQEFFEGGRNWQSLPGRVRRLCEVLEAWVRTTYLTTKMEWNGDFPMSKLSHSFSFSLHYVNL